MALTHWRLWILLAAAQFAAAQKRREPVPTFGTTVVDSAGLRGLIYYLQPNTTIVPERLERMKSHGTIYTRSLNVTPRHFTAGFPGVTKRLEWFAIDYGGKFWVEQGGDFDFSLTADDGAVLFIDDRLVVDNDGIHPARTKTGRSAMAPGTHSMRVSYFQGPRDDVALVLEVARPGEAKRVFSFDEFRPR